MQLKYTLRGRPSSETVLLLNGMGLGSADWSGQSEALEEWFQVVAVDRRGHGDSPFAVAADFDELVDDVIETLDALGIDKVHVVGLSMGGSEAMNLALRWPRRVSSLVLVNTFSDVTAEERQRRLDAVAAALTSDGMAAFARNTVSQMVHADLPHRRFEELVDSLASLGAAAFTSQIETLYAIAMGKSLASLACPTLVLASEFDRRTPVAGVRALAGSIPGAEFDVISDAGHFPHLEQTRSFNDRVAQFLLTKKETR